MMPAPPDTSLPDSPLPDESPDSAAASRASEPEIRLQVNGETRCLRAGGTVAQLLEGLGLGGKRVAVAVNRTVVVRSRYAERSLAEGDHVEILEAVGGG